MNAERTNSEPLSEGEKNLLDALEVHIRGKQAMRQVDDRELLWLLKMAVLNRITDELPMFGYQMALVDELEDRLYPEYDGDKVTMEDWGWQTPEGPIIYSRKAYDAEQRKGNQQ